jgi:hypothetical protein
MIEEFLIQQIGEELSQDQSIDIQVEPDSMGKILYRDLSLEHGSDETTYVELYAQIPRIKLEFWGQKFGFDSQKMLEILPSIVAGQLNALVNYVLRQNVRLENLEPSDLTEEGLHQEFREEIDKYIIQINLTAKTKAKQIL